MLQLSIVAGKGNDEVLVASRFRDISEALRALVHIAQLAVGLHLKDALMASFHPFGHKRRLVVWLVKAGSTLILSQVDGPRRGWPRRGWRARKPLRC